MAEAEGASEGTTPPSVNLQVISPSVRVNQPLSFTSLPGTVTVRQLKEKIRESLAFRPSDDQQRLIHRGRLLARDTDTLQDVFGIETLRSGDLLHLHLVIRDSADQLHHPSPVQPAAAAPNQAPAPAAAPVRTFEGQAHPHPHAVPHHHPQFQHQHPPLQPHLPQHFPGVARFGPGTPPPGFPNAPGAVPFGAAPPNMAQILAQQHHNQQAVAQWMNHLQGERYRNIINQQQRERAWRGLHGIQDNANGNQQPAAADGQGGRNSPAALQLPQTGANGMQWTLSVNGAVVGAGAGAGPFQPGGPSPAGNGIAAGRGPLSAMDVQNILRSADATQATQTMTDAMHRSASGASLVNMANLNTNAPVQPIQPGVTTPILPGTSRQGSRTATPDPSRLSALSGGGIGASGTVPNQPAGQPNPPHQAQPEVYILSSPAGPRALLINSSSGETYYSPTAIRQNLGRGYPFPTPARPPGESPLPFGLIQNHPQAHAAQPRAMGLPMPPMYPQDPRQQQPQQQQQQQVQPPQPQLRQQQHGAQQQAPQGQAIPVHVHQPNNPIGHPVNPNAGAIIAALWPHVWLIIRLAAFVWWFTLGDNSWYRIIVVGLLALVVFIVNTGWLNGVGLQVWEPVRNHLEGLLPMADHHQRNANNELRDQGPGAPGNAPAAGHPAPAAIPQQDGAAAAPLLPGTHQPQPQQHPAPHAGLNPAETAARLVAERRNANANWVMDQVRRVERAGLLFLASIAPGVAERHIAHLEAQERAAERRRREAEEAAAAAAAAEAEAQAQEQATASEDQPGDGEETAVEGGPQHENEGAAAVEQPQPQLIPI